MNTERILITITVSALCTFFLRALPFLAFSGAQKTTAQQCVKQAKHCGAGMKLRANRSSCSPGGPTILTRSLITGSRP